jgi:anaerobic dimethyl sulfoxide reductase subunit C (anchor subunit)
MINSTEKYLANQEELQPRPQTSREDMPLVLFTLLTQMAVGGVWALVWMFPKLWATIQLDEAFLQLLPILFIGVFLGAGMLASLAHLGTKKNAWRVFQNVRQSSLSKEVLYTGLFGLGLFLVLLSIILRQNFYIPILFAGAAGIGLVYNMAEVYRLPAAPGWNTWRTSAGFMVSAILLGIAAMIPILIYESSITGIHLPSGQWTVIGLIVLVLLVSQLGIMHKVSGVTSLQKTRIGFILVGMALAVTVSFPPVNATALVSTLLSVFVISEEVLGRWAFYRSRL